MILRYDRLVQRGHVIFATTADITIIIQGTTLTAVFHSLYLFAERAFARRHTFDK